MRRIIALALFVSTFFVKLHAGTSETSIPWRELHDKAMAAADRHDVQTAISLLKTCRDMAQTKVEKAVSANDLGFMLYHAGRVKEAMPLLQEALDTWMAMPDSFGRLAETSATIAEADRGVGRYASAEKLMRDALGKIPAGQKLSAAERDAKAMALDELGDLLREQGQFAESRTLLMQAAQMPGVSWARMADSAVGLAELDRDAHNWEESLKEWNNVAELGRDHGDEDLQAVATRGLGATWLDRGNAARAEPLLRNALAAFESSPVVNERQVASTLTSMGQLYIGEDKLALAEDALNKALKVDEHSFGESHPQLAVIHQMLGDALARRSDMESAREHLSRAVQILSGTFGEQSAMVGVSLAGWGTIEQRSDNPERAVKLFERSLAAFRANNTPEMGRLKTYVLQHYAEVLKATHHKQEAKAVLAEAKSFQAPNFQSPNSQIK
jgi:tetratricopeptide (TPR) repeat protein